MGGFNSYRSAGLERSRANREQALMRRAQHEHALANEHREQALIHQSQHKQALTDEHKQSRANEAQRQYLSEIQQRGKVVRTDQAVHHRMMDKCKVKGLVVNFDEDGRIKASLMHTGGSNSRGPSHVKIC
jgi:hypothetical protein